MNYNLRNCLTLPISHKWGDRVKTPRGPYYFRDNGASVLGVAHLDTVLNAKPMREGKYVIAPQLDDRLGVWILLDLLPSLGVNLDILLTTGEESGNTTAYYFDSIRPYNWIVEFDRAGSDVVMYQYDCDEYADLLGSYGFRVGFGSFSDICAMDHLGVAGFNVGIGYHNQHTRYCHANLNVTRKQVNRFARFWSDYQDIELPHDETAFAGWGYFRRNATQLGKGI